MNAVKYGKVQSHNCDLKNKDRNMADNIEHQDKGELVANCDRFNSLKHSTVRSNVHYVGSIKDPNGGYGYPMIKDYSDFLKGQQKLKNKWDLYFVFFCQL